MTVEQLTNLGGLTVLTIGAVALTVLLVCSVREFWKYYR